LLLIYTTSILYVITYRSGFIETEMTGKVPFVMRNVGRVVSALVQSGYPADIAEAALFLSSPASVGLNGHTIRVCGGHIVGA
jgi:3-oxoacyl-[acyl-carrier protein] reductase